MNEGVNNVVHTAYEKYRRLMLKEAYAIVGDYALAEDCSQEAFLTLYVKLRTMESDEDINVQAFLIRTVRNIALYFRRKQQREDFYDGDEETFDIPDNDVEEQRQKQENIEAMMQTVKSLPLSNWQVIKLKYDMGLREKEISERLGLSRKKVGILLSESMEILRKEF